MSDPTDAAKTGAQAAEGTAEPTTQVVDASAAQTPGESSWQRGLRKLSSSASGLGGAVNDKFGGTGGVFRVHMNSPHSMASAPASPAPG